MVQIYNAAEALPNLVNPFWMLPLLGILKMKARDLVGYSVLQMILHVPIVFFMCWLFAQYMPYIPPIVVRDSASSKEQADDFRLLLFAGAHLSLGLEAFA